MSSGSETQQIHRVEMPHEYAGQRIDVALSGLFPGLSRSRIQAAIKEGGVDVDGRRCRRNKDRVSGGELITMRLVTRPEVSWRAQALALNVVYSDQDVIVVNKPPGLVCHPAAGNPDGTLVNALLHYAPELATLPRAGLVHRLDKDTSGLLVVARSLLAHQRLVTQLQQRCMTRQYCAVVYGTVTGSGTVTAPIARHPVDRQRMAVVKGGRYAVTHYHCSERLGPVSRLRIRLETGRTHQIRVHMAHIRHPVVGDPVYGGRRALARSVDERLRRLLAAFPRQALHAERLVFNHPRNHEAMMFHAPLPEDMLALLAGVRETGDHG